MAVDVTVAQSEVQLMHPVFAEVNQPVEFSAEVSWISSYWYIINECRPEK